MPERTRARLPLGADPRLLKLLGHPLRLAVFSKMGERPWSATQLEPVLNEDWQRIREQIRVLHKEGLVEPVGTSKSPNGGRLTLYRAERFYFTAEDWAALPAEARATGSFTFVELLVSDIYDSLRSGAIESRDDHVMLRHPLHTNAAGAKKIEEIHVRAHREIEQVERESLELDDPEEERVRLLTACLSIPMPESGGGNSPP